MSGIEDFVNVESTIIEETIASQVDNSFYGSIFVFGTSPEGTPNTPIRFDESTVKTIMGDVPLDSDGFNKSVVRGAYEVSRSKRNQDTSVFMVRVGAAVAPAISLYENDRISSGELSYTLVNGVPAESMFIKSLVPGMKFDGSMVEILADTDTSSSTYGYPIHMRVTLTDGSTASWNLSLDKGLPGAVSKVSRLVSLINTNAAFKQKIQAGFTPLVKTLTLPITGSGSVKNKTYDIAATGMNESWGDKIVAIADAYSQKEVVFEVDSEATEATLPVEIEKSLSSGTSISQFIYKSSDESLFTVKVAEVGGTTKTVQMLCSKTNGWDPSYSIKSNSGHGWSLTVRKYANTGGVTIVPEYSFYKKQMLAGVGGTRTITVNNTDSLLTGMQVTGSRIQAGATISGINTITKVITISSDIQYATYTEPVTFSKSQLFADVATTEGSNIITITNASTILWKGMSVTGDGIPANTAILDISNNSVQLTAAATATGTPDLTFNGSKTEVCTTTANSVVVPVVAGSFYGTGTVTVTSAHTAAATTVSSISGNNVTLNNAIVDTSVTGDLTATATSPNWVVNTTTGYITINCASGFAAGDKYSADYRFKVIYREAKVRSDILDGDPRTYFIYGDQIIFGAPQPAALIGYYTTKVRYSRGCVSISDSDNSVITFSVADADLPAIGQNVYLDIEFEPELPAPTGKTLVGSVVQPSTLTGGSDGKITDKVAYMKAVKDAMNAVSMYPRRRNVVMDMWMDDAILLPNYETGIKELQPLNMAAELIPYVDKVSRNVEESSILIPTKMPTSLTLQGINTWIDRLINNDSSDLTRPANIIDGYQSFRADAPLGVMTIAMAEVNGGKAYFANPACIYAGFYEDLPINRSAINQELPAIVTDLGVKLMDAEIIGQLNAKRYTTAMMKPDGTFRWADAPTLASRRSNFDRQFVREAVYELLKKLRMAADPYLGLPMLEVYLIPLGKDLTVAAKNFTGRAGVFSKVNPVIVPVTGGRITGTTKVRVYAETQKEIRKIKFETSLSLGE